MDDAWACWFWVGQMRKGIVPGTGWVQGRVAEVLVGVAGLWGGWTWWVGGGWVKGGEGASPAVAGKAFRASSHSSKPYSHTHTTTTQQDPTMVATRRSTRGASEAMEAPMHTTKTRSTRTAASGAGDMEDTAPARTTRSKAAVSVAPSTRSKKTTATGRKASAGKGSGRHVWAWR